MDPHRSQLMGDGQRTPQKTVHESLTDSETKEVSSWHPDTADPTEVSAWQLDRQQTPK